MTIRFSAFDERTGNLVSWMQSEIGVIGPDYEEQKGKIFLTAGYETGYGVVNLSVTAPDEREVIEGLLGLGRGLSVTSFSFTPSRFGIVDTKRQLEATAGKVYVTPEPAGDCEIRLRSRANPASLITLAGKYYGFRIPGDSSDRLCARVSASFLEIVHYPDGTLTCRMSIEGDQRYDLSLIENFATLSEWCNAGRVDVQIWSCSNRRLTGTIQLDQSDQSFDWARFGRVVRQLRRMSGSAVQNPICLSVAELNCAAYPLIVFEEVTRLGSMRVEFEAAPVAPQHFDRMVYYCNADVAEFTLYVLVERMVKEDVQIGGCRRVTCGAPKIVESYVLKNASQEQRQMMQEDYHRHLEREQSGAKLCLGDIREFLDASRDLPLRERR